MEPTTDRVLVEDRKGVLYSIKLGSRQEEGDLAYWVLTIVASRPGAPELELVIEEGADSDALRAMFAV